MIRLGMTARVREVDPLGQVAVVTHWRKPVRLLSLRHLFYLDDVHIPRILFVLNRRLPPRMTMLRDLVYPVFTRADETIVFDGVESLDVNNGEVHRLDHIAEDVPVGQTAMSAVGDWYSYVSDRQRVHVVPSGDLVQSYEPLPRKVIHAHAIDGERRLLASGSWQELALDQMDAIDLRRLTRVGYTKTERIGDVVWIGVAGGAIATAIRGGHGTSIEVRRLEPDLSIGAVIHRDAPRVSFRTGAISTDGNYVAYAYGSALTVVDLEHGSVERFDDHTDAINLVRFAREDHLLISADTDNRLVLRPRTPTGYTCPLIPVSMAAG
jgi:hypothetical protein